MATFAQFERQPIGSQPPAESFHTVALPAQVAVVSA
jgi:hypothetical protein